MNSQLIKQLFDECPLIYRKKDDGAETIVLRRGVECGDGWFQLIHQLSLGIESIAQRMQRENVPISMIPHVSQVKEKFGGLRVYLDKSAAGVDEVVDVARQRAAKTCELCGQLGKKRITKSEWVMVLCDNCVESQ